MATTHTLLDLGVLHPMVALVIKDVLPGFKAISQLLTILETEGFKDLTPDEAFKAIDKLNDQFVAFVSVCHHTCAECAAKELKSQRPMNTLHLHCPERN